QVLSSHRRGRRGPRGFPAGGAPPALGRPSAVRLSGHEGVPCAWPHGQLRPPLATRSAGPGGGIAGETTGHPAWWWASRLRPAATGGMTPFREDKCAGPRAVVAMRCFLFLFILVPPHHSARWANSGVRTPLFGPVRPGKLPQFCVALPQFCVALP